jgi:hypothetical protein
MEGQEISTITGQAVPIGGATLTSCDSQVCYSGEPISTPPYFDPGEVAAPAGRGWLAPLLNLFTAGTKLATVATIQPGTVIAQPGGGYIARQTAGLPVGLNVGGISPNFLLWAAIGLGGLFIVSTAMSKR